MNRLVLIGNGFDLAHGMPTRYNDFLLGYLKYAFSKAGVGTPYKDKLMTVDAHTYSKTIGNRGDLPKTTDSLLQYCYGKNLLEELIYKNKVELDGGTVLHTQFMVNIHSDFLKLLLKKCNVTNWVEIENEYYAQLKKVLKIENEDRVAQALHALNASMEGIIEALHRYLASIECTIENRRYADIFSELIALKEIPLLKEDGHELPKQTMVLNFNYTPTVYRYLDCLDIPLRETIKVNNIHGALNDENNPIVFGFGDELDEHYHLMEKSSIRGFFKYIKSFWYFRTRNYHDLIRFVASDNYEVVILGHSCGLSDRTMLNLVFEHDNCKSIKIYYYQNGSYNNYNELTEEISRHFSSKAALWAKVLPKPRCTSMPQVSGPLPPKKKIVEGFVPPLGL